MTGPTVTTGTQTRRGLRLRHSFHVVPRPATRTRRPTRQQAARSLLWFVAFVVVLTIGLRLMLDYGPPKLRDPEYGRRLERVQTRVAEQPHRPLVLAIGSSRTAMGVRSEVLDDQTSGPMILNFSLVGGGPLFELMAFRRALADGVKPDAVVVEFWPAFLREDGLYLEEARLDITRLRLDDLPLVREYFLNPAATEDAMRRQRLNPWYGHRRSLLDQIAPRWLPYSQRTDGMWKKIGDWGWLPGRESATAEEREQGLVSTASYYGPLFAGYRVSPIADRALRQLVAECREHGIPMAILYLPEAKAFRSLMTPESVRLSEEYLRQVVAELGVPLIDARDWMPDDAMPDGFHLMQDGAAAFTRQLLPAVEATFPALADASSSPIPR